MKHPFLFLLAVALLLNLAGCQQPDLLQDLPTADPAIPSTQEPITQSPTEETAVPTDPTEPTPTEPVLPQPVILPEPEDTEFVRVTDYIPTARVELSYATANNFTGYRIYDFTDDFSFL